MTNRADTVLLGTTRKTVNIKQDLAERHLKNACVEYYIDVSDASEKEQALLITKFILPMFLHYKDTNADIMLVNDPAIPPTGDQKHRLGILFIGGGISWESLPDDLEFHHGSYKLYTVVHYPKKEKAK